MYTRIQRFEKIFFLWVMYTFFFISSCIAQPSNYHYTPPSDLNDGLKIASASSVGIDTDDLEKFTHRIMKGDLVHLRALVLIKDGHLIYEGYYHGARRNDRYTIYSVSKTFTSALTGIAIDKGLIKSVNQAVLPFFPEYKSAICDSMKKNIQIRHLLSLCSGLDWDESTYSYEDRRNIHVQMEMTNDWIRFILERPMKDKPGERWLYNTGNVQLISAIIKKSTGLYLHEFAEKFLFGPLGIDDYDWNVDPSGYTCAGGSDGGLRLMARDIAKLGCLYANKGLWNGKRILSEAWIHQSTQGYISTWGDSQYGYLWHVGIDHTYEQPNPFFYHTGSGGHILMVYPQLELVIVINSGPKNMRPIIKAITDMIVKS